MYTVTHETGDHSVELDFTTPDRALRVLRSDTELIAPSPIGIDTANGPFPDAYELVRSDTDTREETGQFTHGKRRDYHHRATVATFTFESESERTQVTFELRLTADGVAYRYHIDGNKRLLLHGGEQNGRREHSGFRVPDRAVSWLFDYSFDHEAVGKHYSASLADGEFTLPGLFCANGSWILIAEAGVDGSYAASRLASENGNTLYAFRTPDTTLQLDLPGVTPWRVAHIGTLATIAESTLVQELVEGPETDPEWIEPGRVAWSWWGNNESPSDFGTQKRYVEYAAERGWEYVLVDEGWSDWVPELVEYAEERGVGIFIWAHWTELNRADDRRRRLDRWADWGVAGIKVDFMDSDDQGRHQFYDQLMEETAERTLLLNVHGSVVPTGVSTRWSHVLTYEGVKGAEHLQWTGLPPEHNTVLPYTRNVVGSMDYTPVTFSAGLTSLGHELALSVVFESGLQHFADRIDEYAARPAAEWFLERVPAAWDDTTFLCGRPGSEATVARLRDGDWFIGAVTAGPSRTVTAPLSFLDAERDAHLVRESEDGERLIRETVVCSPNASLSIDVAENGGFCAYVPAPE